MSWIIKQSLHLPTFSHVNLLLLLLYLALTANHRSIPFGYLHVLVRGQQCPFLGVLDTLLFFTRCAEGQQNVDHKSISEELYGEGDKRSGDAKLVEAETLLEAIY
jgi:hypothetical protein